MTPTEYLQLSGITDDTTGQSMRMRANRLCDAQSINDLHAIIGIVTEAGELADAFKRYIFYNKPIDLVNIKEEAGDVLWYLALLLRSSGLTFEECFEANIAKLKVRFGDKFKENAAINRDLDAERKALEQ